MIQFSSGDGVVLVDHGNHAHREQSDQRGAEVAEAGGIAKIVFRQQDLRGAAAQLVERIVVDRHQAALSDGRARLNLRKLRRAAGEADALHAQTHRARRHDQHVATLLTQSRYRLGNSIKLAEGQTAVVAHDDVRPHLDHDAAGVGNFLADGYILLDFG